MPLTQKVVGGHAVHWLAAARPATSPYVVLGHSVGTVDPSGQYVDAGHSDGTLVLPLHE